MLGAAAFAALSVAALSSYPYVPFVAVIGVLLLALATARPMVVTVMGILAIPLEGFGPGFVLGPSQVLLGAAALGWLIRWAMSRPRTLPRHPALLAFAALVAVALAGVLFAQEPLVVARQAVAWAALFVICACIAAPGQESQVRTLLFAFAICGGIAGLIAVVHPQPLTGVVFGAGEVDRATAGLGSPNALGILLLLTLPIQLMFALRGPSLMRSIGAGCAVLSFVGLSLAVSRGSFIGVGVALLVLLLWAPFRRAAVVVLPLVVVLALIGANPASPVVDTSAVVDRVAEVETTSEENPRWRLWEVAPEMIGDNPVFGIGALNYSFEVQHYGIVGEGNPPNHAHNVPLTIAIELGLVGLAAFIALVISIGAALQRVVVRGSGDDQAMGYALLSSYAGLLASGIVDYGLTAPPLGAAIFIVMAGCAVALALRVGSPARAPARAPGAPAASTATA